MCSFARGNGFYHSARVCCRHCIGSGCQEELQNFNGAKNVFSLLPGISFSIIMRKLLLISLNFVPLCCHCNGSNVAELHL
jgi:hypothetical protein